MSKQFVSLAAPGLMELFKVSSLNEYADGLALLDDLLCGYDIPPRKPGFHPIIIGESLNLGHPELIRPEFEKCVNALSIDPYTSSELAKNLNDNFSIALSILEDITEDPGTDSHTTARRFLSGLLSQYATVLQIDPHAFIEY